MFSGRGSASKRRNQKSASLYPSTKSWKEPTCTRETMLTHILLNWPEVYTLLAMKELSLLERTLVKRWAQKNSKEVSSHHTPCDSYSNQFSNALSPNIKFHAELHAHSNTVFTFYRNKKWNSETQVKPNLTITFPCVIGPQVLEGGTDQLSLQVDSWFHFQNHIPTVWWALYTTFYQYHSYFRSVLYFCLAGGENS